MLKGVNLLKNLDIDRIPAIKYLRVNFLPL